MSSNRPDAIRQFIVRLLAALLAQFSPEEFAEQELALMQAQRARSGPPPARRPRWQ